MKRTRKAEETGSRIFDSALALFRESGFDTATMRDIAAKAGVATGGACYYYPFKDTIVLSFYQRACDEMQPEIQAALKHAKGLEARLRALIRVKLVYFAPNRDVLRALLRNGPGIRCLPSAPKPRPSATWISIGFDVFWWPAASGSSPG
jgi:AcrR family transcriptional regulator